MDGPIALEDIDDVYRYATRILRATLPGLEAGDHEDARAEAVALVYLLHGDWDARRCRSFADFISTYLPFRLISWVRREMRQRGNQNDTYRDGHRVIDFHPRVVSLEGFAFGKEEHFQHRPYPVPYGSGASPIDHVVAAGLARDMDGRMLVGWIDE